MDRCESTQYDGSSFVVPHAYNYETLARLLHKEDAIDWVLPSGIARRLASWLCSTPWGRSTGPARYPTEKL